MGLCSSCNAPPPSKGSPARIGRVRVRVRVKVGIRFRVRVQARIQVRVRVRVSATHLAHRENLLPVVVALPLKLSAVLMGVIISRVRVRVRVHLDAFATGVTSPSSALVSSSN